MFKLFTNKFVIAVTVIQWILSFLNIYIVWREYNFVTNIKEQPEILKEYMTSRRFYLIKEMNESKLFFEVISNSIILLIQIIWFDELALISLWNYSEYLAGSTRESMVTLVFIAVITCRDFLFAMPMWLYTAIKFGNEDWADMIQITFLTFCFEIVSQCVLLSMLVYISNILPNISKKMMVYTIAALILGLFIVQQLAFLSFVSSYLVPLEEPNIIRDLKPFLQKMSFPEDRIYQLHMENPTDMPNAFTVGSWFLNNEMIVVTDNVIGKNKFLNNCCSHKEVVSIILHELGHVYYNHVLRTELLDFVIALSTAIAFVYLNEPIVFASFGFVNSVPTIINILIRLDVVAGYVVFCTLIYMIQVRNFEYQADFFSSTFSKKAFRSALVKLHLLNPVDLQTHDTWYSVWNLDHPSLLERLKNVKDT